MSDTPRTTYNIEVSERHLQLEAAIAYLRGRNKYVTDTGCNFVPTSMVQTDVGETVRTYRREVEQSLPVSLVKGNKK